MKYKTTKKEDLKSINGGLTDEVTASCSPQCPVKKRDESDKLTDTQ